jgi:LuxR family maltose regulon positive regulatory protein
MLEALERANLFMVALDDQRGWYRYHHLFAEMLRSHLRQKEPTLVSPLHRRASAWYEQHELPAEAVQHALAIPDVELAARLIEPIALPLTYQGQISTVLGWINALPEVLVQTHPFLCVSYAHILTVTNQLQAALACLQQAERRVQEDLPAEQALELLPEAEAIPRAGALVTTIRAIQVSGDVTPATEREIAPAVGLVHTSNNLFAVVSSMTLLARLYVLQGRLRKAAATYEQVVQAAQRQELLQTAPSSLSYYFGLGDLLREWNWHRASSRQLSTGRTVVACPQRRTT